MLSNQITCFWATTRFQLPRISLRISLTKAFPEVPITDVLSSNITKLPLGLMPRGRNQIISGEASIVVSLLKRKSLLHTVIPSKHQQIIKHSQTWKLDII